jgi:hypothetical protein
LRVFNEGIQIKCVNFHITNRKSGGITIWKEAGKKMMNSKSTLLRIIQMVDNIIVIIIIINFQLGKISLD